MPDIRIEPDGRTLHGTFTAAREPVVWVDPGDRVHVATLDVSWGLEPPSSADRPRGKFEPRAETPGGLITFGIAARLDDALVMALNGMLAVLQERYGRTRADALAVAGVAVAMRITQVANRNKGAHALLPHDTIERVVGADDPG